jgi:hypothetical protein
MQQTMSSAIDQLGALIEPIWAAIVAIFLVLCVYLGKNGPGIIKEVY